MSGNWLLWAVSMAIAVPAVAQVAPPGPTKTVEGATADRVARIQQCQGHKFDTMIQIDPVAKRSTRVKLCANPGSSDADWVNTLEAAIEQIEQRAMPEAAKDKVIAELRQEMSKFAPASKAVSITPGATLDLGGEARARNVSIEPAERYETSVVPPLPAPLPRRAPSAGASGGGVGIAAASPPVTPMRFRLKCLSPGETGGGSTCDFFDARTVLLLSPIEGFDKGGTLLFRRRGEERGTVDIAPLAAGKTVRIALPREVCRGVANTRIELEMREPGSGKAIAGRAGPYDVRC